jgi:hypothetical protein
MFVSYGNPWECLKVNVRLSAPHVWVNIKFKLDGWNS